MKPTSIETARRIGIKTASDRVAVMQIAGEDFAITTWGKTRADCRALARWAEGRVATLAVEAMAETNPKSSVRLATVDPATSGHDGIGVNLDEARDDLLLRCHAEIEAQLRALIEGHALWESPHAPADARPRAICKTTPLCTLREMDKLLRLVRDIETEVGRLAESDSPQWLRDVIEGRIKMWESDDATA